MPLTRPPRLPASPAGLLLARQFTFLLDDIGVPANYRHMEGFGVHTFLLLNKDGRETLVKFHWKPTCGACVRGGALPCLCGCVSAHLPAARRAVAASRLALCLFVSHTRSLTPSLPSRCPPTHPPTHPGVKCLLEDEAVTVGGNNHSHATQVRQGDASSPGRCPALSVQGGCSPSAVPPPPYTHTHTHSPCQDLYEAIAAGDYPEWRLFIQTMDPADQDK